MVYDDYDGLISMNSQKPRKERPNYVIKCALIFRHLMVKTPMAFPKIPRPRHQEDQAVAEIGEQRQRNMHLVKQNQDLHKTIVAWSNIPGWNGWDWVFFTGNRVFDPKYIWGGSCNSETYVGLLIKHLPEPVGLRNDDMLKMASSEMIYESTLLRRCRGYHGGDGHPSQGIPNRLES